MRLIKNGDVILDGTLSRAEKEKQAFEKLEKIEQMEEEIGMEILDFYKVLPNTLSSLVRYAKDSMKLGEK